MSSATGDGATGALLVTGAAGFIGSRFVALHGGGRPLISVDEKHHVGTRPEHAGIDFGTIVDRDELPRWLADTKPALAGIVHLGACTDTTELDVAYLTRVNLEYTQTLWRHATAHRIPFVYASSAAVYGDGALGYDDADELTPRFVPLNPYGESKLQFDVWALGEERAGRTPPAWSGFRFFNVYGPGERHKGKMASVVLHAFDQIRSGGEVTLFRSHKPGIADGEQKRDFVYVDDVADVLAFALAKPLARGIYNLGTGTARTFLDLVRATFRASGAPEQIRFVDTPEAIRERYQYFTEARMDRLRAAGWTRPFTSLEDGVARYVGWLRAR
ncbi:ADP-glyceromanno-heptose 6-epimerase [Candidatus Binatia bacterium]|nr:ADP-glyceromanno-heptose 6-epimerase [Candidatus Binatia bacterium]